jgi:hypothetical protein
LAYDCADPSREGFSALTGLEIGQTDCPCRAESFPDACAAERLRLALYPQISIEAQETVVAALRNAFAGSAG